MKTANENTVVANRLKVILRTSIIGIIVNAFLGVFKAIVGTVSHSIAITLDAVNNFTDAGSSLITILSTSFSVKEPNKKHPFGYGRIEYLGTLLIAIIISYAGITAFVESIKGIIHHEVAEYSTVSIIIIVVAVIVKTILAIFLVSGFAIEAWLGVIIALFIIKAGVELILETVTKILGTGAEASLVREIKGAIVGFEHVVGAYDLVLNNYGPDSYLGSVHIEVEDTLEVSEFDALSRQIQEAIAEQFGVFISAVGVYSINTKDEKAIAMREAVKSEVLGIKHVKQLHVFYMDDKNIRFDVVI